MRRAQKLGPVDGYRTARHYPVGEKAQESSWFGGVLYTKSAQTLVLPEICIEKRGYCFLKTGLA